MKQPRNDEDIWVCKACGQGLGKHSCPNSLVELIAVVKLNRELRNALLLVAECDYDDERKIKDVPAIRKLIADNYP